MGKAKVRWAYCAADPSKNGKIDHVEAELAGILQREGRLTILADEPEQDREADAAATSAAPKRASQAGVTAKADGTS